MGLTDYFEVTEGTGILATADSEGNVDLAIYAHPHMENDETAVLVMSDKLSHANLQTNPKAAFFRNSAKRMILNWFSQSEGGRDMAKRARLCLGAVLYTSKSARLDHWSGARHLS
jgi:hypothetical protein